MFRPKSQTNSTQANHGKKNIQNPNKGKKVVFTSTVQVGVFYLHPNSHVRLAERGSFAIVPVGRLFRAVLHLENDTLKPINANVKWKITHTHIEVTTHAFGGTYDIHLLDVQHTFVHDTRKVWHSRDNTSSPTNPGRSVAKHHHTVSYLHENSLTKHTYTLPYKRG